MSTRLVGLLDVDMVTEDPYGHRTYTAKYLINSGTTDGPYTVLQTAGLPMIGSHWVYGSESDIWAICHPQTQVQQVVKSEPNEWWIVTVLFSTKPIIRCQNTPIDNPLSEPALITGSTVKYTKEAGYDVNGVPLVMSTGEQARGIEQDFNRDTVSITVNVPTMDPTWSSMIDTTNQFYLWGFPPNTIKFSDRHFEKLYYGVCFAYFRVTFNFDINYTAYNGYQGWNAVYPDAGELVLGKGGSPGKADNMIPNRSLITSDPVGVQPLNGMGGPANYTLYDLLDNFGNRIPNPNYDPSAPPTQPYYGQYLQAAQYQPYIWSRQLYPTSNLLLLPIPGGLS